MEILQKRVEGKQQDILWSNEKIKSIRLSETLLSPQQSIKYNACSYTK
jgi:hypothetical protein